MRSPTRCQMGTAPPLQSFSTLRSLGQGIGTRGSRQTPSPSESELTEEFGPLEEDLELPTWGLGTRYLLIAQPASQDDLTGISLSGGGNSISAFTKFGSTITIDGISYEIWVSNEPQGQVISGYNISVRS